MHSGIGLDYVTKKVKLIETAGEHTLIRIHYCFDAFLSNLGKQFKGLILKMDT